MTADWMLWAVMAIIAAATIAFVMRPLWRGPAGALRRDRETRLLVLRDRRAEIDDEEKSGRLDPAAAEDARRELVDTLAAELSQRPDDAGTVRGGARALALGCAAIAVLAAIVLYLDIGQPDIETRLAAATTDEHRVAHQVATMVAETRARLSANPADGEAWAVLAQLNGMRGDLPAAADAYRRALEILPPNARLLADYAEVLAIQNDRRFSGRPLALLRKAITIDPDDAKTNGLLGAALFQEGHAQEAIPYLEKVLAGMAPESPQARQIGALLAELRNPAPAASGAGAAAAAAPDAAAAGVSLAGTVTLQGQVAAPGDTLFVLVRAADGPRMPYAVQRIAEPAFPLTFELGQANLMTPQRPIPADRPLVIEARLSASGQAMRQSGDRFGTSEPFVADDGSRAVVIDQRVP
ncbi:MAG: c-type cytochrome biogenesis protein CcmI [Burkholderiaceae bacterium]